MIDCHGQKKNQKRNELESIAHRFLLEIVFHKINSFDGISIKIKKVLFSHAELVPHKSFISDEIHASSQYITPLPPPSAMSQCRGKFTVTSHKSEIQRIISIWME